MNIFLNNKSKNPLADDMAIPIAISKNILRGAKLIKLFNILLIKYWSPVLLNRLWILTVCVVKSPVTSLTP